MAVTSGTHSDDQRNVGPDADSFQTVADRPGSAVEAHVSRQGTAATMNPRIAVGGVQEISVGDKRERTRFIAVERRHR